MGPLLTAARPTHWVKNLWIGAPLVFAGRLTDGPLLARTLALTACFCALASAVYLVNDVHDAALDRAHPDKRRRPVAAGSLSVAAALGGAVVLLLAALAGAAALSSIAPHTGEPLLLGLDAAGWCLAYLLNNVVYTLALKRVPVADVLSIALGFGIRLGAGSAVLGLHPSRWLLTCGMCLALLLALGKRRLELGDPRGDASPPPGSSGDAAPGQDAAQDAARPALAGYSAAMTDRALLGVSALCVTTYLLYTVSEQTVARLGSRDLLFGVPLVLVALARFTALVRSPPRRDLVALLLHDRWMLGSAALWLLVSLWVVRP